MENMNNIIELLRSRSRKEVALQTGYSENSLGNLMTRWRRTQSEDVRKVFDEQRKAVQARCRFLSNRKKNERTEPLPAAPVHTTESNSPPERQDSSNGPNKFVGSYEEYVKMAFEQNASYLAASAELELKTSRKKRKIEVQAMRNKNKFEKKKNELFLQIQRSKLIMLQANIQNNIEHEAEEDDRGSGFSEAEVSEGNSESDSESDAGHAENNSEDTANPLPCETEKIPESPSPVIRTRPATVKEIEENIKVSSTNIPGRRIMGGVAYCSTECDLRNDDIIAHHIVQKT